MYKQRANPDEEMLSMISPEEWGPGGPEYVGGYRLEFDMSWTELKDCDRRGNEIQMINKILDTSQVGKTNWKEKHSFSYFPPGCELQLPPLPVPGRTGPRAEQAEGGRAEGAHRSATRHSLEVI